MDALVVPLLILGAVICIWLFCAAVVGAFCLFEFAAEQGFVGLAAYVACWVFLFPFMLGACIIVGILRMHFNK